MCSCWNSHHQRATFGLGVSRASLWCCNSFYKSFSCCKMAEKLNNACWGKTVWWSFFKDRRAGEGLFCPPPRRLMGKIFIRCSGKEKDKEKGKTKRSLVKWKESKRGVVAHLKRKGKQLCEKKREEKTQKRNRRRQKELTGAVFEYIMCLGTVKSCSIDGVYLPQQFAEKFSIAAGLKVELTDIQ